MKYIITENQYISLILRRRMDDVMKYMRKSVAYKSPCDFTRQDFVYMVAWHIGNDFYHEAFTGVNTLSDVRRWVEENFTDYLLKYWDEKCGKNSETSVVSESKIDEFRTKALDDLLVGMNPYLHPDFIIIPTTTIEGVEVDNDGVFMEYDPWDGRLFVRKDLFKHFYDMYGFEDVDEAKKFISDWFSKKFNVEVKYVKA